MADRGTDHRMPELDEVHRAALPCAACVDQLTRFQTSLIEEADAEIVREHLSSCPSCRLFSEQLETVADFVGSAEPAALPDNLSVLADTEDGELGRPGDLTDIVRSLYRLARSLDP